MANMKIVAYKIKFLANKWITFVRLSSFWLRFGPKTHFCF